jgi:hypothetical protein
MGSVSMRIVVLGGSFGATTVHTSRGLAGARMSRSLVSRESPSCTMASLGIHAAVAQVFGVGLTGFGAWWMGRTYYLR